MERHFPRDVRSLDDIFGFVHEFLSAEGVDATHSFDVDLVVEELFTNLVKYSRDGRHEILIGLDRRGRDLLVTLRDFDVEAFDVSGAPDVDISLPLAQRKPGGLGIHLVRRLAKDLRYDYRDRNSTITVTLGLEP